MTFTNILHFATIFLLSYIYDHLKISCFTVIFIFTNAYEGLNGSDNYFTCGSCICSFTSMVIYVLFVQQAYLFFSASCQHFLKLYTHMYLYKMLMPTKGSHLCSLKYSFFGKHNWFFPHLCLSFLKLNAHLHLYIMPIPMKFFFNEQVKGEKKIQAKQRNM